MNRYGRRFRGFLWCAGLIGVSVALVLLRPQPEPSLLQRATPIADLEKYNYTCWLSNTEMLLVRNMNDDYPLVSRLDVTTRKQTPQPALRKAMQFLMEGPIYPAPDGKRVLCPSFDGDDDAHVVNLETAKVSVLKTDGETDFVLNSGAKDWMLLKRVLGTANRSWIRRHVFLYEAANLQKERLIPMQPPIQEDPGLRYQGCSVLTADNHLLATYIANYEKPWQWGLHVLSFRVEAAKVILEKEYQFPMKELQGSEGVGAEGLILNPQNQRVYWNGIYTPAESGFHRLMRRLQPGRFPLPQPMQTLWSAHFDGTDKRTLGQLSSAQGDFTTFQDFRFSPDGKRMSFTFNDKLYLMNAE